MGAHLDYNGGPVMPMAIDQGTFVAVRRRPDDRVRLATTLSSETLEANLRSLPSRASGSWFDYPLGVLRHLAERTGDSVGIDMLFGGNLPIGAGLSSSASICVGTAFALLSIWEHAPDPFDCIRSALWGEREFVGVKCGIMDPYAVALARQDHLLWLDCKDASFEHLPLDSEALTIAVADSGVRRELAQGAFNERVSQCAQAFEILKRSVPEVSCLRDVSAQTVEREAAALGPLLLRRVRHVTSEVERTFAARGALVRQDLETLGRIISGTHASLRDQYEVSIPELDGIVESALSWKGVLGARLTGAGFGGCAVIAIEAGRSEGFAPFLKRAFRERFGREPKVYSFRASGGPRELN